MYIVLKEMWLDAWNKGITVKLSKLFIFQLLIENQPAGATGPDEGNPDSAVRCLKKLSGQHGRQKIEMSHI